MIKQNSLYRLKLLICKYVLKIQSSLSKASFDSSREDLDSVFHEN